MRVALIPSNLRNLDKFIPKTLFISEFWFRRLDKKVGKLLRKKKQRNRIVPTTSSEVFDYSVIKSIIKDEVSSVRTYLKYNNQKQISEERFREIIREELDRKGMLISKAEDSGEKLSAEDVSGIDLSKAAAMFGDDD